MATLHLICGLPCAGKTTLAKQLERDLPALRLPADEWMLRITVGGNDPDKRTAVEGLLWETAVRAVILGINAVVENGFWTRAERDEWRARAAASGIKTKWHFLDAPLDELHRRLALRNAALPPYTFPIEPALLDRWAKWWEPPADYELA
jgi:predicted kinase